MAPPPEPNQRGPHRFPESPMVLYEPTFEVHAGLSDGEGLVDGGVVVVVKGDSEGGGDQDRKPLAPRTPLHRPGGDQK